MKNLSVWEDSKGISVAVVEGPDEAFNYNERKALRYYLTADDEKVLVDVIVRRGRLCKRKRKNG